VPSHKNAKLKKQKNLKENNFYFQENNSMDFSKVVALAKVKVEQTFCFNNQFEFFKSFLLINKKVRQLE
jgi:hypothetical protein